jgi:hypothetical protein
VICEFHLGPMIRAGLVPHVRRELRKQLQPLTIENTKYLGIKSGDAPAPDDNTKSPSTVVVGEPTSKSKLKAFVIMTFTEKNPDRAKGLFEEVLRSLITPAGLDAGNVKLSWIRHPSRTSSRTTRPRWRWVTGSPTSKDSASTSRMP